MSDIREMAIVFGHVVQHYGDPAKAVYEQHRIIEAQTAELNRLRAEVESRMAECRKHVLLEAAKIAGRDYVAYLTAEPFIHENFGFNLNEIRQSKSIADELRRMAEGEKE